MWTVCVCARERERERECVLGLMGLESKTLCERDGSFCLRRNSINILDNQFYTN